MGCKYGYAYRFGQNKAWTFDSRLALPAIFKNEPYSKGMALCFVVWVVLLPFVIDWRGFFGDS